MIQQKNLILSIREVIQTNGLGTLISVYNDIEQNWYYYVGEFKQKNPSNNIYYSYISGKCINYILDNQSTYFNGELAKNELIVTKIQDLPKEQIEFDFKFVWFK